VQNLRQREQLAIDRQLARCTALTAIFDDVVVSCRGESKEPTKRRVVLTIISCRVLK